MHPLAEQLAQQFISDFWAANHEIEWLGVEEERTLWLTPTTVLVGRIDAHGQTGDGQLFFADWKTLSASKARRMTEEKAKWRRDPQALTYGVLSSAITNRFTVRWAIKTAPPTTDFEWYTYEPAEIEHWRGQLIDIADEIRYWRWRGQQPWRTNFTSCYRYGAAYACPFINRCPHAANAASEAPRTPHLDIERTGKLKRDGLASEVVVIDASRVRDYLECPEKYRLGWEGQGFQETNDNLTIGTDFHNLIADHITSLRSTNARATE